MLLVLENMVVVFSAGGLIGFDSMLTSNLNFLVRYTMLDKVRSRGWLAVDGCIAARTLGS